MTYKDFLKNLSFENLAKIIKSIPDNAVDISYNDKLKNKTKKFANNKKNCLMNSKKYTTLYFK